MNEIPTYQHSTLSIPPEHFKPKKKCLYCHSFYLTDTHCEQCGRKTSTLMDDFESFTSGQSYFSLKEKYLNSWDHLSRFYPQREDKNSTFCRRYVKKLYARFHDLLFMLGVDMALPAAGTLDFEEFISKEMEEQRHILMECELIMDELVKEYEQKPKVLQEILVQNLENLYLPHLLEKLHQTEREYEGWRKLEQTSSLWDFKPIHRITLKFYCLSLIFVLLLSILYTF